MSVKTVRRACQPSTVSSTKSNTLITHWSENMEPAKETCETPWSQPEGITSSAEATSDWIQKIFISVSYIELWNGSARFPGNTSSGVILRHLLELAPAAWHTAYARHQQSSARWKHTDGQSGLILKQTTQIYLFTMRLMRASFYYAFNAHFLTTSWQPYACLNSQNYHPPHGTPSFMAFPTYKLGCDRRYISMGSECFYDKFYFMPINPFIHFSMAHRWSDRLSFSSIFFCFCFLPHSFQPLHKSLGSLPKNRALPRISSTSNNSSSSRPSSRPLQSLSKTSPGWVLTGCNFNEVRTRCERGTNEVRNQILGDWPPKSSDKLFGSHTLSHSFQNSKTQELSAVEQKETEEETKGE